MGSSIGYSEYAGTTKHTLTVANLFRPRHMILDERVKKHFAAVEVDIVQTVRYINYELHIGWPWQWEAVPSGVTSQ